MSSRSDAKDAVGGDLRLGARQFQTYEPGSVGLGFLNEGRWVSVMRETSRWEFDADGPVQPFEEVEAYNRRSVQERFTPLVEEGTKPSPFRINDHRLMLARREIGADDDIVACSELA